MGTPDFAVPSLDILIENGYNVVGVITATDKRGGRGNKKIIQSAVKQYAVSKGLNVLQPSNLKDDAFLQELRELRADLQIVVAFRMLPKAVWDMPPLGTMNLHGSLLPKYRGAAPINWAVINGDKETGVSTFFLQHAIDTGSIFKQTKIAIEETDTAGSLHDKMMAIGAQTVLESVNIINNFEPITKTPQDESLVSHAPKLFHDVNCQIDFTKSTESIYNQVRGLSPYPTSWFMFEDLKMKVFFAEKEVVAHNFEAGSIHSDKKTYLKIAAADGFISLKDVQLQGKKRMEIKPFLNGWKPKEGTLNL